MEGFRLVKAVLLVTFVAALGSLSLGADALAQVTPTTVFRGLPAFKISEGGVERIPEALTRQTAANLIVVISKIGNDYLWASRENVPLIEIDSIAYTTFVAVNGSGYVRVLKPERKRAAGVLGGPEAQYDYVEHLLIGLRSVTYYGSRYMR